MAHVDNVIYLISAWKPRAGGHEASRDRLEGSAPARLRILIVEDEALLALDMEMALSDADFEIVGMVDTEDDALCATRSEKPDVVLMDIALREGNGISAARAILSEGRTCVVFLSGNSDTATRSAAEALNPAGFIGKPYDARRLPALVQEAYVRFTSTVLP